MHAVTSLLTGIRGAEGGYARIFVRGTTTRATWYDTFEGDNADSSGDDIALDENGGVEVYVSELVDVVVLDSDGAEIRRFTDGYSAGSIEVRSQSFTGTNYDDASTGQGSNFPTTLQAILDLWLTNSGWYDWKTAVGDTPATLLEALGPLVDLVYNVKSPEFGAAGNGVANDQTAIDAAIAAAAVDGGIVFFPAGTYRHTAAIIVPANVSLLGAGSSASIITTDHASQDGVTFNSAGSYAPQTMRGLRVAASQTNTGERVNVSTGAKVKIEGCYLGGTNTNGYALQVAGSGSEATVVDCTLSTPSANKDLLSTAPTSGARARYVRCKFVATASAYTPATGLVVGTAADFVDCIFDASACTSGTVGYYVASSTTLDASFRGCRFVNGGGATVTALTLGSYTATSVFEESDSFFGTTVTAYSYLAIHAGNSKGATVRLHSRLERRFEVTDDSVTIASLPWDQYGTIVLKRTTNADQTVNLFAAGFATVPPDSSRNTLVVWNASGGAIANEIIQVYALTALVTHTTLNNQQCAVHDFLSFVFSGTLPAVASVNVTDQQSAFG